MQMEGSMRTMSWSRYHCLSWSFMRIRAGLRHGRLARAGHKITTTEVSAPVVKEAAPGRRRQRPAAIEGTKAGRPEPDESDPQPGCFEPKRGRRYRYLTLEHDPEKWMPVFLRDKRQAFAWKSCSNK
jgi:hypothetical protein